MNLYYLKYANEVHDHYVKANSFASAEAYSKERLPRKMIFSIEYKGGIADAGEDCNCEGVQDLIAGTGTCRKCGGQTTY